jgi:hypothetical protein
MGLSRTTPAQLEVQQKSRCKKGIIKKRKSNGRKQSGWGCATPDMQLLGQWKEPVTHFQEQDMLKMI